MHAPPTVKTRQLLLRAPDPADVDALFEIQSDPEAMRYTYVAPDRDATARYLEAYAAPYFIHPSYWGRGLATELVQASLQLAFRRLGLKEVLAFTKRENLASQRVLEKAGFAYVCYVPELERDRYSVEGSG
jgi:RimJ/RimL family protein N-acetyltransferase